MAKELPFDEDVMTLFRGIGGYDEPGQHGREMVPAPKNNAIDIITQIKDLCEEFLLVASKEDNEEEKKPETEDKPDMEVEGE